MDKKKYKISDLASILGVSTTAVRKKIKDTPEGKRYKGVYETFSEVDNGKEIIVIALSDNDLEKEKKTAGTRNGCERLTTVDNDTIDIGYERLQTVDYVEGTAETTPNEGFSTNDIIELTKLHEERLATVHNGYCERIIALERQKLAIECSDNSTKLQMQALQTENKIDKQRYKRLLTVSITVMLTLLLMVIAFAILFVWQLKKPPKIIETQKIVEKVVEKPVYIDKTVKKNARRH